jgi:molybdopterin-binding protein
LIQIKIACHLDQIQWHWELRRAQSARFPLCYKSFGGDAMKLSARNQIKGRIIEVKKGATTAHVRVEITPGQVIMSSITNEAVEDLGLKVGDAAIVVIKASDVMIGVA